MDLDASDEQLDSPFVYCSARKGIASLDENVLGTDFVPLFETILSHIPAPQGDDTKPLKMLVSSAEQNDFVGKLAIGRIEQGTAHIGDSIVLCNFHEPKNTKGKIVQMFAYEGLKKTAINSATVGDIVCIAGVPEVKIGDTVCSPAEVEPIEFVKIDRPSVEMMFMVNDSPFAGREGEFVTSRHLRDRLFKEAVKDLSLEVYDTESADTFRVCGRGEMHLSILIENMRRDGYEFQVSMPRVMFKVIDGKKCEPVDRVALDVPEDSVGTIMGKMGMRRGELIQMTPHNGRTKLEFFVPTRGLFGFKSQFLTDTQGEGIMSSVFYDYEPYKGEISHRDCGSLIAFEQGEAIVYGLYNAQERGELFIAPGTEVYAGMVVGENPKGNDLVVNVCKRKHLSNCRSAGSDDALRLTPPRVMSLEDCLEFLNDDELLEVTPKSIRIRKKILDHSMRAKARGKTEEVC